MHIKTAMGQCVVMTVVTIVTVVTVKTVVTVVTVMTKKLYSPKQYFTKKNIF